MRNKIQLLLLVMVPFFTLAQVDRSLLKGKIVADSLEVANVSVTNKTAGIVTMTDVKGDFRLMAKEKDTLVFSGINFHSSHLIVSHTHLADEDLTIRLSVKINVLDEIIVRPYTLTGNLETDTKKLKVKTIDINVKAAVAGLSAPQVKYSAVKEGMKSVLPTTESSLTGIDLKYLGSLLYQAVFKPKPKSRKIEFITDKIFSDAVKEKFSESFFTETLKLKPEQIDLFLAYCDDGSAANRALLNPKKEFELIDYLLKKSEEYLKKNQ
ncbi:carboxypeptidase-like regulatory domain-containing protein [Flavobacterium suncheonense]|uniref:Uncharacterized protein n=1 Tax=Flavobacterium suncheonense GH29-5 = DSM 17707 TaxID=1121899 RepID=A0A0A2MKF7_9FLAO|nr:carboxypeptidase-like regulatory domain-containing protein [Flavobacterium suncheonense]KGO88790.1 hypothetical protein Q764_11180 [Flavobacterium suncheonense GH29-5 = DSM 17707]